MDGPVPPSPRVCVHACSHGCACVRVSLCEHDREGGVQTHFLPTSWVLGRCKETQETSRFSPQPARNKFQTMNKLQRD